MCASHTLMHTVTPALGSTQHRYLPPTRVDALMVTTDSFNKEDKKATQEAKLHTLWGTPAAAHWAAPDLVLDDLPGWCRPDVWSRPAASLQAPALTATRGRC